MMPMQGALIIDQTKYSGISADGLCILDHPNLLTTTFGLSNTKTDAATRVC